MIYSFSSYNSSYNAVDLTTKNDLSLVNISGCDMLGDN